MIHPFWKSEEGAATVDYVVVLSALTGLGLAISNQTNTELAEHSAAIRGEMQNGLFETAWDNQLAVLPDTEAGEDCDTIDTCGDPLAGTPGDGTGTNSGGDNNTGDGNNGGDNNTGTGTTDPTPDPDPDPTPDPDPDPTPDPDPDPTPDPTPTDPNDPNHPNFPPAASAGVAGCPSNIWNGIPLVSDGSDFGGGYDHTIEHSGYTDLRTCGNGMPNNRGFFDANPTFTMYLSDMEQFDRVQFLVESTSCDTTILIRDAAGNFHFNDDFNYPRHTRSRLRLTNVADLNGRIDIWIGGYNPSTCTTRFNVRGQ